MNPRLRDTLEEINSLIEQIRTTLRERGDEMDSLRDEHEELRIEHWRLRKELVTLQRTAQDAANAERDNLNLLETQQKLKAQLQGILCGIKALRAEFRP